jgi:hypothetical protein
MNRSAAEGLMAVYHRMGDVLNDADHIVSAMPDENERSEHRRALGAMMGTLWLDLMLPIVREYRDLDPDKDSEWLRDLRARRARGEQSGEGDA